MKELDEAFVAGYACLAARADLLDRINVFPVADGDTGVNLRISLAPLRSCNAKRALVAQRLYRSATGNSGNIAVSFFGEFLQVESLYDLADRAALGREKAWRGVADPRNGTMLDVFDALTEILSRSAPTGECCPEILTALQNAVLRTTPALPELSAAGVVDAGALGMFVFFDGFFRALTGYDGRNDRLADFFPGRLAISADFSPAATDSHCVDVLIRPDAGVDFDPKRTAALGESVVVIPGREQVKVHLHTSDPLKLRQEMEKMGEIVSWSDESMSLDKRKTLKSFDLQECLHIMTDAAGSLSQETAGRLGITLLDSYIVAGDSTSPESLCTPETIYAKMRAGEKVTTAQASLFERHQHYKSVCEQYGRTLYLCVGSAFTGNHATAVAWKKEHDQDDLLMVVDTGAASGRLGVIAMLVARYRRQIRDVDDVLSHAQFLVESCKEYVFIDVLRYLVAGGRVSRTGGFFGDLLHMKPVISPTREGVKKMGVVRDRQAQVTFAVNKLRLETSDWDSVLVLLQYSDNETWVSEEVHSRIQTAVPKAEIVVAPLSLTSGVHMGPGTWSLAFAPVK